MPSFIEIKFNSPLEAGDLLQIQDSYTPTVLMDFKCGFGVNPIPISGVITDDIFNIQQLIDTAYNSTNRYIVTVNYSSQTITIVDNIGSSLFSVVQNDTSSRLTVTISNDSVNIPVSVNTVASENITNPCALVDLVITTNKQVTEITSPVIQPVSTNPFTITGISRDSVNDILVSVNDGISSDSDSVFIPLLNPSLFKIEVLSTPTGGIVNAIIQGQGVDFDLTYSLDNITFFSSSSFSNLNVGNYTMYIKDSIGCSTSIPFEITAFNPNVYTRVPYFKISEQNSLITVKKEIYNSTTVFKNPLNTLSYEENSLKNHRNFKQVYEKTDGIITQQYRSNYDNVEIKLIDCDKNETILISTKKSNNFNITDVRDVTVISVDYNGNAFVGVQYGSGNTYDPNTLSINGSYNLGTESPEFMNEGDYIQIEGAGWFTVTDVLYYNNKETLILSALVSSFPITVTGQTLKGTSIYNALDYELYEFSFDCNSLDGDYYITYKATDSEFSEINEITEYFNVSETQERTYLLSYFNSENNETNYSTGIINKIRVYYINDLTYIPNDTQEIYLTDTNAVNIESTYRDFYVLDIYPCPMGFVRKIGLALSNDRLFLNGLSLLKNSELETERLGVSNLYSLRAQFVRSDYAFVNIADDGSIVLPSGEILGVNDNTEEVLGTKDNQ